MKKLLSLIVIFFTSAVSAQTADGYYITLLNDTIPCKIKIGETLLGDLDLSAFTRSVTIFENNTRKKFKPEDIRLFAFTDAYKHYTFLSLPINAQKFYHESVKGKLSLYYEYGSSPYDGSLVIYSILIKNGSAVTLNSIRPGKQIEKLINDCPTVYRAWKETNRYSLDNKEKIVIDYNSCP